MENIKSESPLRELLISTATGVAYDLNFQSLRKDTLKGIADEELSILINFYINSFPTLAFEEDTYILYSTTLKNLRLISIYTPDILTLIEDNDLRSLYIYLFLKLILITERLSYKGKYVAEAYESINELNSSRATLDSVLKGMAINLKIVLNNLPTDSDYPQNFIETLNDYCC